MQTIEKFRIVNEGAGCLLRPPTHPNYFYSVASKYSSLSVTYSLECGFVDNDITFIAKSILDKWEKEKPNINSEIIQDWILRVHGYNKYCYLDSENVYGCYVAYPDQKNTEKYKRLVYPENSMAVIFIRKFYPEYVPLDIDFGKAYYSFAISDQHTHMNKIDYKSAIKNAIAEFFND